MIDFGFIVGVLILCTSVSWLSRRLLRRKPRGVASSLRAVEWAESRFPNEYVCVAAFVADVLRDQLGVGLGQLDRFKWRCSRFFWAKGVISGRLR